MNVYIKEIITSGRGHRLSSALAQPRVQQPYTSFREIEIGVVVEVPWDHG